MTSDVENIIEHTLVPHKAFEVAVQRLERCFANAKTSREPICLALVGESRTGKSRALEEFMAQHERVRTKEGLTVPILKVTTPSKPTVKGLVQLMVRTMGDKAGARGTEVKMTEQLKTLMENTGCTMLVIDEFQHFFDKGTKKVMEHAADWLKTLVDDTHVALVVSGLPSCGVVIENNEQLRGRFLRPVRMPRFNWLQFDDREELIAILAAFDSQLRAHFDIPRLDTEDMAYRFYCATGGLIGYLAKILREAEWAANADGRKFIKLEHLADACHEALWQLEDLQAMKNPFSHNFSVTPTADVLAMAQAVGTRNCDADGDIDDGDETQPILRKRRNPKRATTKLLQVMQPA